jgi:hypothetical protein
MEITITLSDAEVAALEADRGRRTGETPDPLATHFVRLVRHVIVTPAIERQRKRAAQQQTTTFERVTDPADVLAIETILQKYDSKLAITGGR